MLDLYDVDILIMVNIKNKVKYHSLLFSSDLLTSLFPPSAFRFEHFRMPFVGFCLPLSTFYCKFSLLNENEFKSCFALSEKLFL